MKRDKKIAIIFFSLEAKKEARFKKFSNSGNSINENISSSLISETRETLKSTGLPFFHYHQANQIGNTFGEKLANAYQEVFDLGYEFIISIGNDSPEINQLDWTNIAEKLQNGESVIGPNLRGGTYLIGINKSQFYKSSFASLPWQSGKLFKALVNYCESAAPSTNILEKIRDINTIHDLKLLVKNNHAFKSISKIVQLILSAKILVNLKKSFNFQSLVPLPGAPFRAPPQFL